MGLPQSDKIVFYHPLDDEIESTLSQSWAGPTNTVAGKVGDAQGNATDLTGGDGYPFAAAAQKMAFAGWFVRPAEAPATTTVPAPPAGESTAGYACSGGGNLSTIEKLTFSDDTVATNASGLTATKYNGLAGFASTAGGYYAGGYTSTPVIFYSTIDKLSFSDDSVAAITSGLTQTKTYGLHGFESIASGYACGGIHSSADISTIDKLTFAVDTVATNASSCVGTGRYTRGVAGFSGTLAGYACAGSGSAATATSTINKLSFSDDSVATNASNLSRTSHVGLGGFESTASGFAAGGQVSSTFTTIDKLSFLDDTISVITSGLAAGGRKVSAGTFSGTVAGYACGGLNFAGTSFSSISKLTFSNDNVVVNGSSLAAVRSFGQGFENSPLVNQ